MLPYNHSNPTNLIPLTLAVVLLEETLVIGDTVLTEHKSMEIFNMCQLCGSQLGDKQWSEPGQRCAARADERVMIGSAETVQGDENKKRVVEAYPAMRGAVRNILAVMRMRQERGFLENEDENGS